MKIVPTNTKTGKDKAIIVAWWLVVLFAIISLFTGGNASSRIGGFLCFAIIAALLSYVAARRIQDQQTGEPHTKKLEGRCTGGCHRANRRYGNWWIRQ